MSISYTIDSEDRLIEWNDEWIAFANANDGGEMADNSVRSRSLWDFIKGSDVRYVYRGLIERARDGASSRFEFRCDAPAIRRRLEMSIEPLDAGSVRFEIRTLSVENRPVQVLLDRSRERTSNVVNSCSWCARIRVGVNDWHDLEHAVSTLGLFEDDQMPQLAHGMCGDCYSQMDSRLKSRSA